MNVLKFNGQLLTCCGVYSCHAQQGVRKTPYLATPQDLYQSGFINMHTPSHKCQLHIVRNRFQNTHIYA